MDALQTGLVARMLVYVKLNSWRLPVFSGHRLVPLAPCYGAVEASYQIVRLPQGSKCASHVRMSADQPGGCVVVGSTQTRDTASIQRRPVLVPECGRIVLVEASWLIPVDFLKPIHVEAPCLKNIVLREHVLEHHDAVIGEVFAPHLILRITQRILRVTQPKVGHVETGKFALLVHFFTIR